MIRCFKFSASYFRYFLLIFYETQPMSAKKYLTTTMLVFFASISLLSAQDDLSNASASTEDFENDPQFLLRTEHNGQVKYVECALQNRYFQQATTSTPIDSTLEYSEFTAKGAVEPTEEYFSNVFFLVQEGIIVASNESGNFKNQPDGMYKLSRFSYPLSISPKSFEGKEFITVANHPLFEEDPTVQNINIRLYNPKKESPVLSKEPIHLLDEEDILGQIQSILSLSN